MWPARFQPGEMITNKPYQRLLSEYEKTGKIIVRAMKADVHPQTARKYLEAVQPPAERQAQHLWRRRPDPVAGIWERAEQRLSQAAELAAKELLEYLCGMSGPEAGVSQHRTIRVKKVTYSVPARLIGQEVRGQVYEGQLQVFHGRQLLLSLGRAAGDRGAVIAYRHRIEPLLRKPGAFAPDVPREELFPASSFRLADDRLDADHGERAGRLEYLPLLRRAAEWGEAAISRLVGECSGPAHPGKWRVADLRRYLGLSPQPVVPELQLQPEWAS